MSKADKTMRVKVTSAQDNNAVVICLIIDLGPPLESISNTTTVFSPRYDFALESVLSDEAWQAEIDDTAIGESE